MNYSELAERLKPSELGMLLALADMPDVYNFFSGYPAEDLFPLEEMEQVDREILRREGKLAVQYGSSQGYLPLREKIAARMKARFQADCKAEDILITSGSQQGLSLLGQLFLNKDDVVLVGSPTYLGAINAFQINGPRFVEVPTDDKGIIPEKLDAVLQTTDRVKLMYVSSGALTNFTHAENCILVALVDDDRQLMLRRQASVLDPGRDHAAGAFDQIGHQDLSRRSRNPGDRTKRILFDLSGQLFDKRAVSRLYKEQPHHLEIVFHKAQETLNFFDRVFRRHAGEKTQRLGQGVLLDLLKHVVRDGVMGIKGGALDLRLPAELCNGDGAQTLAFLQKSEDRVLDDAPGRLGTLIVLRVHGLIRHFLL